MKDYLYKIIVYQDGQIIKADKAFEKDFPAVRTIREKIRFFDEREFQFIKLPHYKGEQTFICKAKTLRNGNVELKLARVAARPIEAAPEETRSSASFEEEYRSLIKGNAQVLAGEVYFANLHEIMTVFGRRFAERVRNVLLDRISEKFRLTFPADYYHANILFADSAVWQNVINALGEIVESFNRVVKIDDNLVKVKVKCGFAVVDRSMDGANFEYVMSAVGGALKRAEESDEGDLFERKDFYLYQEIQKKVYAKYFFKIDIPKMIENDDFYLEYQPQYDVKENRIVGFEALFRVKKHIQVNASVFEIISYAEQSGNMVRLGDFIFDTGMKFAKSIEGTGVKVSLNVSAVQLMQEGFVDNFMNIYNKYELKPGSVALEVSEAFLSATLNETLRKLELLSEKGIDIYLDDFGIENTSFKYLTNLPISAIKIDRSFVTDIGKNRYNTIISKMIIDIAETLDVYTVSEGVETVEQLKTLEKQGCNIIQGYLISKAVGEDVARNMIKTFRFEG